MEETLSEVLWYVASTFLMLWCCLHSFQLSLGDARSYYVTTARNDLGVIFATSEAGKAVNCFCRRLALTRILGATMEPVSWQEMRCPKTGKIEKRKCAKPEGM